MDESDKTWVVVNKNDLLYFECDSKQEAENKQEKLDVNLETEVVAIPKSDIRYGPIL